MMKLISTCCIFILFLIGCATIPDSAFLILEKQNKVLTEIESLQQEQNEVTKKNIDELIKSYKDYVNEYYNCKRPDIEIEWENLDAVKNIRNKFKIASKDEKKQIEKLLIEHKTSYLKERIDAKKNKALEAGEKFRTVLLEGSVNNHEMIFQIYAAIKKTNEDVINLLNQGKLNAKQVFGTMDRVLDFYEENIKEKP